MGHAWDPSGQSGSFTSGGDRTVYPPNIYAPQAQTFYYRGSLRLHSKLKAMNLAHPASWSDAMLLLYCLVTKSSCFIKKVPFLFM